MKAVTIGLKTLREALRDPQLLILFLLFPAMLVVLYFFAYGGGAKSLSTTLVLLVDNKDQGALGGELIERLRTAEFDGSPLLTILPVQRGDDARTLLSEWKAGALLTIPADFSDVIREADPGRLPQLHLLKDSSSDTAVFLSVMIEEPLRNFVTEKTGWRQPGPMVIYDFVKGTGNLNDFQFGVPGVIIFGLVFGVMYTAILLVREMSVGAFQRLRLAGVSSFNLLGGITLAQLAVCLIQVVITVLVACVCGLQTAGSYLLLVVFSLGISLAAIGCGMITACFSKSDGEAANFSMLFILPLVFFSDVMYPMPPMPLFSLFGRTVLFSELIPTTFAADAVRRIMIYGDGMASLWPAFLWMLVETALLYLAGIGLFQRFRIRHSI